MILRSRGYDEARHPTPVMATDILTTKLIQRFFTFYKTFPSGTATQSKFGSEKSLREDIGHPNNKVQLSKSCSENRREGKEWRNVNKRMMKRYIAIRPIEQLEYSNISTSANTTYKSTTKWSGGDKWLRDIPAFFEANSSGIQKKALLVALTKVSSY